MARDGRFTRRAVLRVAGSAGAGAAALAIAGCATHSGKARKASVGTPAATAANENPLPGGTVNLVAESNALLDSQRTTAQATTNDVSAVALSRLLRFKTGADPSVTENYELESDLALSSESPDGVTWTFKLHPGAKFHNIPPVNGHAVEADDIKASFQRALDAKNPNRGALEMIDPTQIQTPAPDTVVFKLKYTYAWFNAEMASPKYSWVFPREALSGAYDPGKQVIGSGPFIFQSYTPDVEYVFKKNPDWFEKGRPYLEGMREAIIPNDAQQLAQFTGGNLDMLQISQNSLDAGKQGNPKATVITSYTSSGGGYPLYFQMGDPNSPFQDIRLRQAISLAIDRQAIAKALYNGQAQSAFIVPPGMGKWALKMEDLDSATALYFTYDPNRAKQLLAASGAGNTQFKLRYMTGFAPFGDLYKTQAEMINNMLNAAGLKTTLVPMDYAIDYVGGGKGIRIGNFPSDQIIYTGVSTLASPDEFVFGYLDSKSTVNLERLNDPVLDTMIARSRAVLDENERLKAVKDIQKYVAQKLYIVNGFPQGQTYQLVQPWVHNYQLSNTGAGPTETWTKAWLKK